MTKINEYKKVKFEKTNIAFKTKEYKSKLQNQKLLYRVVPVALIFLNCVFNCFHLFVCVFIDFILVYGQIFFLSLCFLKSLLIQYVCSNNNDKELFLLHKIKMMVINMVGSLRKLIHFAVSSPSDILYGDLFCLLHFLTHLCKKIFACVHKL